MGFDLRFNISGRHSHRVWRLLDEPVSPELSSNGRRNRGASTIVQLKDQRAYLPIRPVLFYCVRRVRTAFVMPGRCASNPLMHRSFAHRPETAVKNYMGLLFQVKHCKACGAFVLDHTPIVLPPSPTPHLRRTLRPPNAVETSLIEESLATTLMTITHIDEEIEKLFAVVHDLQGKRHALHQTAIENQSFAAPVRRLPPEILEDIFMLCCPSKPHSSFIRIEAPLLLTRVCVGWRDLAQSSQRLWANFTISIDEPFDAALAEAWLSRAKSIPLSPTFRLPANLRSGRPMWPVLSQVIRYCDRWQHLVLEMPASTLGRFHSVEHRIPALETLSIDILPGSHTEPITAFQFAPRLCRLRLESDIEAQIIKLPWHQLTSFSGRCDSLARCFALLSLMPNLVDLTLSASETEFDTSSSMTAILPHLVSLDVSLTCETAALFERLRCPILNTLRVWAPGVLWESGGFVQFLSCCTWLRHLTIARSIFDSSILNIIPCVEVIPSLTTLILDAAYFDWRAEDTLRQLTVTDSSMARCLLPALENLHIKLMPLARPQFAAMVRSRIAPGNPGTAQLRTLTLSVVRQLLRFDQESMRGLCANLENGIEIELPFSVLFL